jgi:hypothetical protein
MKPEEQRIAFLEYLGWTKLNRDSKLGNFRALRGISPDGKTNQVAPNPLLDLNVMHEAENNNLKCDQLDLYYCNLRDCCDTTTWFASASERLEAFLKTVELWKE